jgi:hypothetical protein
MRVWRSLFKRFEMNKEEEEGLGSTRVPGITRVSGWKIRVWAVLELRVGGLGVWNHFSRGLR